MLKKIEQVLSALADVKLLTEYRSDLAEQYHTVQLKGNGYFLYVDQSLGDEAIDTLKDKLELLLLHFEQLDSAAEEYIRLNAEIKAMRDANHPDHNLEMGVGEEFGFLKEFGIDYALFQEKKLVVNSGLSPHILMTSQEQSPDADSFELLTKHGKLLGYRTDAFSLFLLSSKQLNSSIKDILQAKLWWLTRVYKQVASDRDLIFNTYLDSYFRIDNEGLILDYQVPDYIELPSIVLGVPLPDMLTDSETKARFAQAVQQVRQSGTLVNIEYPIISQNRTYFHEARFAPLQKAQIVVIIRDITERKKAEGALLDSEERYRSIVEHSQAGITIMDGKYQFAYVNNEFCRIVGYEADELIGTDFRNVLSEESIQLVSENYIRRRNGEDVPLEYEFTLVHKNGEERRCALKSSVYKTSSGKIRTIGQILDITERKKAERELRQHREHLELLVHERTRALNGEIERHKETAVTLAINEERLRTLINSTPDIICFKDGNGRWLEANDADLELFALTDVDYRNKTDSELAAFTAPMYKEAFLGCEISDEETWKSKELARGVEIIPAIDGTEKVYDVIKVPLFEQDGSRKGLVVLGRDVTEREQAEKELLNEIEQHKQARNALQESEKRFRDIVLSSSDWIWEMDANGRYTYASGKVKEVLGYTAAEIVGKAPFELMRPEDLKREGKKIRNLVSNHQPVVDMETWRVTKDGDAVCMLVNAVPIFDDEGDFAGYRGVDKDITKRKQIEKDLKQADTIIRTSPAVAFMSRSDDKKRLEFISDNVVDLLGYTAEEMISAKVAAVDITHPDDWAMVKESTDRCIQDDACQDISMPPYRMISKDGQIKWIDDRTHIIRDKEGSVINTQGVLLDISRLKQVEEDLRIKRQQAETLQTAAEALGSTLELQRIFEIILNELRKVVPYDSASIQRIKGDEIAVVSCAGFSNPEKIIGLTFDLMDDDIPNCEVVRTRSPLIVNDGVPDHAGVFTIGSWMGVPLLFSNEAIGMLTLDKREFGFYTDEHAQLASAFAAQTAVALENIHLFDETEKAREEALRASELKSRFLARISHELRTPLSSIFGYSELLYDGLLGSISDKQKEAIKRVMDNSDYLASLVNDLLEHAQIESGNIDLQIKSVNVNELLANVQSKVDILAVAKGLTLNIYRDADVPADFLGDERRLQQILINLLGNAVKFSNAGDIALHVKYEEPQISFIVKDNGIGISTEAQTYIFDSFRQVKDSTIIQKQAGTGLGLPIAKQLAIAMGGDITVESTVGQGSTFSVLLPITLPEEEIVWVTI